MSVKCLSTQILARLLLLLLLSGHAISAQIFPHTFRYIYFFVILLPFRFGHRNAQPNCSNYNNLHKSRTERKAEIKKRKAPSQAHRSMLRILQFIQADKRGKDSPEIPKKHKGALRENANYVI